MRSSAAKESPRPELLPESAAIAVSLPGLVADVGRSKRVRTRTGRAQNVTYDDSSRPTGGYVVHVAGLRAVAREGLLLLPFAR